MDKETLYDGENLDFNIDYLEAKEGLWKNSRSVEEVHKNRMFRYRLYNQSTRFTIWIYRRCI